MPPRHPTASCFAVIVALVFACAPAESSAQARAGAGTGRGTRAAAEEAGVDFSPKPPITALTPADQLKRFILQPGYRMEAVLADPVIEDPAQVAFDGNGRLFVLEERGYQQGNNDRNPVGRISRHEDADGDGTYEKHTVFVDGLVFPRFVLPFGRNAVLTLETDKDEIWKYTDADDDGIAERKELFLAAFGQSFRFIENIQASLTPGLDNWMYVSVTPFRGRWTPGGIVREATATVGGQWGVTQDDDGKMWFQSGNAGLPLYFQFPSVYGNFPFADAFEPGVIAPWGAPLAAADAISGMGIIRPDGSLSTVTAGAGNDIVRAHRMPADLQGDYLYGEFVARIVRRLRPTVTEGLTQVRNAYTQDEFIKSTDPLFRPLDIATAPDGTLFIADMYRGNLVDDVQNSPESYIRARIDQFGLDKIQHHGRIWRVSFEGLPRDRVQPRMLSETPAQLVAHLSHPNGWWRDTAQQLLVLAQDKSIEPDLRRLVRAAPMLTARFHALWVLEGIGALDAALVREAMKDREPRLRIQAIRASETLYKTGDTSFEKDYVDLTRDADVGVAIQAVMTLNTLKTPGASAAIAAARDANPSRGMQTVAGHILNPPPARGARGARGAPPAQGRATAAPPSTGRAAQPPPAATPPASVP